MERLTYRISSGASNLVGIYEASNPAALRQNGWERLAAYEDILFAPDGTQRITLERLSELVTAEQDGRCVVLPCKEFYKKAGDTLFAIDDVDIVEVVHCGTQISPDGEVYITVVADDKVFPYRQPDAEYDTDPTDWCTYAKNIDPSEFGKTVFLTRAAAEAALQEGTPSDWTKNKACRDAVLKTFGGES